MKGFALFWGDMKQRRWSVICFCTTDMRISFRTCKTQVCSWRLILSKGEKLRVDSLSRRFLASMVYIISPISLRLQTNAAQDFTVEGSIVLGCLQSRLTDLYALSSPMDCSTQTLYSFIKELSFLHLQRSSGCFRASCAEVYGVITAPWFCCLTELIRPETEGPFLSLASGHTAVHHLNDPDKPISM